MNNAFIDDTCNFHYVFKLHVCKNARPLRSRYALTRIFSQKFETSSRIIARSTSKIYNIDKVFFGEHSHSRQPLEEDVAAVVYVAAPRGSAVFTKLGPLRCDKGDSVATMVYSNPLIHTSLNLFQRSSNVTWDALPILRLAFDLESSGGPVVCSATVRFAVPVTLQPHDFGLFVSGRSYPEMHHPESRK